MNSKIIQSLLIYIDSFDGRGEGAGETHINSDPDRLGSRDGIG